MAVISPWCRTYDRVHHVFSYQMGAQMLDGLVKATIIRSKKRIAWSLTSRESFLRHHPLLLQKFYHPVLAKSCKAVTNGWRRGLTGLPEAISLSCCVYQVKRIIKAWSRALKPVDMSAWTSLVKSSSCSMRCGISVACLKAESNCSLNVGRFQWETWTIEEKPRLKVLPDHLRI